MHHRNEKTHYRSRSDDNKQRHPIRCIYGQKTNGKHYIVVHWATSPRITANSWPLATGFVVIQREWQWQRDCVLQFANLYSECSHKSNRRETIIEMALFIIAMLTSMLRPSVYPHIRCSNAFWLCLPNDLISIYLFPSHFLAKFRILLHFYDFRFHRCISFGQTNAVFVTLRTVRQSDVAINFMLRKIVDPDEQKGTKR